MIGERGRANAARVLDDTCVITRLDSDPTWVPGQPLPDEATEVHTGPCSLLAPRDHRESDGGGDERSRTVRTLLLPVGAYVPVAGDVVTVLSLTDTYVVQADQERSHRVLARIRVVDSRDAEGVPR